MQRTVLHPVQHHVRMTTTHGQLFTAGEAARACGVSRTTISRAAAAGRIPGAERDDAGAWTLPLSGLLAGGFNPGKPSPPEDAQTRDRGDDDMVPRRVYELELALADARAEARVNAERAAMHEARAAELERAANAYWQLQLEAAPSPAAVAPQTPLQSAPIQTPAPEPDRPPQADVGRFRRAWNIARFG